MMRALIPITLFLLLSGSPAFAADAEKLVHKLRLEAHSGLDITKEEKEIAQRLQSLGAESIPHLLPLLTDDNAAIRDLAAFTLAGIDGLAEEHLEALIESYRRGNYRIAVAISRIGTPDASRFLVEEFVRQRKAPSQLTWAIDVLGGKAVPPLLEVYEGEAKWDPALERAMMFVMTSLGDKAATAVKPLFRIATDDARNRPSRRAAVWALGAIGEAANSETLQLQMRPDTSRLHFADPTDVKRLAELDAREAGPLLTQALAEAPFPYDKTFILRDVAVLQARGIWAGQVLTRHLDDREWDVRVAATRALGYIGYSDATDQLVASLRNAEDWRLVFSAADALGRLESKRAISALTDVSTNHWYPPVRDAAVNAIEAIRQSASARAKYAVSDPVYEFDDHRRAGDTMESLAEEDAKSLRFPVAVAPQLHSGTAGGAPRLGRAHEWVELKVDDGYFVGTNRGEWGGELMFVGADDCPHLVMLENIEAIYETPSGIFAVTGLAHMDSNDGFIYKIMKAPDGTWFSEKWRALPGAPRFSRLLQDGDLFVSCHGGIVRVSTAGEIQILTRAESLRPDE